MFAGDALSIRRNSVQLFIEYTREQNGIFVFIRSHFASYSDAFDWSDDGNQCRGMSMKGKKWVASENSETIFPCFVWVEMYIVCLPQRAANKFHLADMPTQYTLFVLSSSPHHKTIRSHGIRQKLNRVHNANGKQVLRSRGDACTSMVYYRAIW